MFLNWLLIVAMLYLTAAGSVIWFFTLRLRNNFHTRWAQQTPITRIAIQDMVSRYPPCMAFSSISLFTVHVLWLLQRNRSC